MSRPRLMALLLALVTLLVYLPVARDGFLDYDDNDYVTQNPVVQRGLTLEGIKWAFTTWHASNWHPLTWISHMTDCELFGLNPGAQHFVNVLFHAANVALLFILLLRLTGTLWPAVFVAALFAWHPLHVESVAWISERKDVLSTFFALLALLFYEQFVQKSKAQSPRSKVFYILTLVMFAFALMSKPMFVTLPFVMLLLDFWPLKRFTIYDLRFTIWRLVWEKIPFFVLTIASCTVTFLAQRHGEAVRTLQQFPFGFRVEDALVSYGNYLFKTVWPVNLAVFYPLPDQSSWIHEKAVTALAALILISWLVWRARRTHPYLIVGWLWFLGTLVPVIGLVQVGSAAMADRYTYFPLIGIFVAAAFGFQELSNHLHFPKIILPVAAVIILGACLLLTEKQLTYWRDSVTLFTRALAVTPDNASAEIDLGVALELENHYPEALEHYRRAAHLEPKNFQVHYDIGNLLGKMGNAEGALPEFREAIRLDPQKPLPYEGLGVALTKLGRYDEAMVEFREAARLDPAYPWPHFWMAKVLLQQGRDSNAVAQLREALRLSPDNFEILAYTARVLAADENSSVRDGKAALILATKANALTDGTQPFVLDALGMAYAETGDFTNAITAAQDALNLAQELQIKNVGSLQQRLELYKNHQPWRESFLATNLYLEIFPNP